MIVLEVRRCLIVLEVRRCMIVLEVRRCMIVLMGLICCNGEAGWSGVGRE